MTKEISVQFLIHKWVYIKMCTSYWAHVSQVYWGVDWETSLARNTAVRRCMSEPTVEEKPRTQRDHLTLELLFLTSGQSYADLNERYAKTLCKVVYKALASTDFGSPLVA